MVELMPLSRCNMQQVHVSGLVFRFAPNQPRMRALALRSSITLMKNKAGNNDESHDYNFDINVRCFSS